MLLQCDLNTAMQFQVCYYYLQANTAAPWSCGKSETVCEGPRITI